MSERAAQSWLSSHHEFIPALEVFHHQALETLENHSKTVSDLADIIALDPGMSISLYHEVNGKLRQAGKNPVASIHSALCLLGDSAIADLVMQHEVLEQTQPDALRRQSYHQLMSRNHHLLSQLDTFIRVQGIKSIREVRSAALLHNLGEFCACLFDHQRYRQYQQKFLALGSDANSAKPVFGFDFHELGRVYAEKSFLPELVTESLDENLPAGRKARLIQHFVQDAYMRVHGIVRTAAKISGQPDAVVHLTQVDAFQGFFRAGGENFLTSPIQLSG